MKKIIAKPHLFFFGLVPIFIIIAFLSGDKVLDINIHDTYFVVSHQHLCYFFAVFFAMIGINYFSLHWAQKSPKRWLTILHLFFQLISLIPMIYFITIINNNNLTSSRFVYDSLDINLLITISFLIFLLSILIHLINFFTSLFLKKSK